MKAVKSPVVALLFFIVAAYSLYVSVSKPYHNWDMIMYVAAAKSLEEANIESLHAFTYEQLQASVSKEEYEKLINTDYRLAIRTDSSAFAEQLSFYQIRPLYNGTVYLLYKVGVNIVFATHIVSAFFVILALFFLYLLSVSFLVKPFMYVVPFFAFIFGVTELAQYSTPDGLAFLAVIVSSYLYLKQRISLLLLFIPIIIFIRTDLILFTVPLLFFTFIFEKNIRREIALSMLASIIIYIAIGAYWENPGWSTIVYFTLVEYLSHPVSMPPSLTFNHYSRAIFVGVTSLLNNKLFLLYAFISLCSIYMMMIRLKTQSFFQAFNYPFTVLSIVCMMFFASHFIAFPVAFDRFFSGIYLMGTFSFLYMIFDKKTDES